MSSVNWKCFFAGLDNTFPNTKLFVPSKKSSPIPPYEVDRRLQDFFCQVSKMFYARKSKNNLLPFQRRMLADIQSNTNIVIAQADKNLGPVGVDLHRYIQDGLKHIQDKHSYEIISQLSKAEKTLMSCVWRSSIGLSEMTTSCKNISKSTSARKS